MTPHEQYADLGHQERSGRFGIWVFIGSEVLFFGALFALYAGFRAHYTRDFEEASRHAKLWLGTANTYILLTSSLFVALGVAAIREGKRRQLAVFLVLTILCGLAFLVIKGVEYSEHFREGIEWGAAFSDPALPSRGALLYFTMYFVMTGLHALHVLIGVILFGGLLVRMRGGRYTGEYHLTVEVVGIYWHFVDIVWLFLWPSFYLMH